MGNDWGDNKPLWQRQGRSGPNGPKYTSRADRASVRRTGKPGQGGGCRKAAVVVMVVMLGTSAAFVYAGMHVVGVL